MTVNLDTSPCSTKIETLEWRGQATPTTFLYAGACAVEASVLLGTLITRVYPLLQTEVEDMTSDSVCEGTGPSVGAPETTGGLIGPEMSPSVMECGGCGERVRERTVLCVGGRTWHSRCLRCCACARPLHDQHSCFLKGMRLYCRHDYAL